MPGACGLALLTAQGKACDFVSVLGIVQVKANPESKEHMEADETNNICGHPIKIQSIHSDFCEAFSAAFMFVGTGDTQTFFASSLYTVRMCTAAGTARFADQE